LALPDPLEAADTVDGRDDEVEGAEPAEEVDVLLICGLAAAPGGTPLPFTLTGDAVRWPPALEDGGWPVDATCSGVSATRFMLSVRVRCPPLPPELREEVDPAASERAYGGWNCP
jgi:hypothetical protein